MTNANGTRRDLSQYLQSGEAITPPNFENNSVTSSEQTSTPLVPLFEESVSSSSEPINRDTFAGSVLTRPIVITGVVIAAFIVGGLWTFLGPQSSQKNKTEISESEKEEKPLLENKAESATPEQIDKIKAENALIKQQQEIQNLAAKKHSEIRQPPIPQQPNIVRERTKPVRIASTSSASIPARQTTYPPSPPVVPTFKPNPTFVPRYSQNIQPPPRTRTISSPTNPVSINRPVSRERQHTEQIDPAQAWLSAAQIGSYGQVPVADPVVETDNQYTGTDFFEEENIDGPVTVTRSQQKQDKSQQQNTSITPTTEIVAIEELPILKGEPLSIFEVSAGTVAKGVINRAIAWTDTHNQQQPTAKVTLTEPLTDKSGTIVIPAGSALIVELVPGEGGLVYLDPFTIEVGDKQFPIEPDTLMIYLERGRPLVAKRIEQGGKRSGPNFGGLLFDAARTLAEVTLGGNNSDAYQQLYQFERLNQLYDKHFDSDDHRRNATPVTGFWVLEAGTKIEVYVNKVVEIRE